MGFPRIRHPCSETHLPSSPWGERQRKIELLNFFVCRKWLQFPFLYFDFRWCGIVGGEWVNPALLGWHFVKMKLFVQWSDSQIKWDVFHSELHFWFAVQDLFRQEQRISHLLTPPQPLSHIRQFCIYTPMAPFKYDVSTLGLKCWHLLKNADSVCVKKQGPMKQNPWQSYLYCNISFGCTDIK